MVSKSTNTASSDWGTKRSLQNLVRKGNILRIGWELSELSWGTPQGSKACKTDELHVCVSTLNEQCILLYPSQRKTFKFHFDHVPSDVLYRCRRICARPDFEIEKVKNTSFALLDGCYFLIFFAMFVWFSINLAPSGAKYCEKGWETCFGTFWIWENFKP